MNLANELNKVAEGFKASAPSAVVETLERGMELAASSTSPLAVGDLAPDFTGKDASGELVSLADLRSEGPVVLNFYRGGWCPFCNLELRALQEVLPEFQRLGATLVAISPEAPDGSLSTRQTQDLEFHVVSDIGGVVSRSFGLSFLLDDHSRDVYDGFGIDLSELNQADSWELPIPGTFVVKVDGTIGFAHADADYRRRVDPAQILRAIKEIGTSDQS